MINTNMDNLKSLHGGVQWPSNSVIVVSVLGCICIYYLLSWLLSPLRTIPGPMPLPILGNMLDFMMEPNEHKLYINWYRKYGPIFKFTMPVVGPIVFVSEPAIIKQILVTDAKWYDRAPFLEKLLPEGKGGVFLVGQEENVKQRKVLNPMFSYASVKRYQDLFFKKAASLRQVWLKKIEEAGGKSVQVDAYWYMKSASIDIITKLVLDLDLNAVEGKTSDERDSIEFLVIGDWNIVWKSLEAVFPFIRWIPTKYRARVTKARNCIRNIISKVANERKEKMKAGETDDEDLLQVILDMYEHESEAKREDPVYHQVNTFLVGGFDTTSTALTWTLYLLAQHKDVQEKARQEISRVLGNAKELIWDHLGEMNYLEKCIRESLRIRAPGDFIYRYPKKDVKIGSYDLPKGTQILIGVGTQHAAEEYWNDADAFKPDRYDQLDESDNLFSYWYMPFSRGPRTCPGKKFAETELKVILATLLQECEFSVPEGHPEVDGEVVLLYKPKPHPQLLITKVGERGS